MVLRALTLVLALAAPGAAFAAEAPQAWENAAAGFTRMMAAEGRVVVRLGQRIVVRLDRDSRPRIESAGPSSGVALPEDAKLPAGAIAFSLAVDDVGGWTLKAENGLSTPMLYGAMIGVPAGDSLAVARTSICTVPSGVVGLEHWRDEVVLIALGPFAPRAADQLTCETLAPPPPGAPDGAPARGI